MGAHTTSTRYIATTACVHDCPSFCFADMPILFPEITIVNPKFSPGKAQSGRHFFVPAAGLCFHERPEFYALANPRNNSLDILCQSPLPSASPIAGTDLSAYSYTVCIKMNTKKLLRCFPVPSFSRWFDHISCPAISQQTVSIIRNRLPVKSTVFFFNLCRVLTDNPFVIIFIIRTCRKNQR